MAASNIIMFPTPLPSLDAPQDVGLYTDQINQLIRYINTIVYGDNIGTEALLKANNLSDLDNAADARSNLGLGSASTHAYGDFDPAGAAAAVQASSLQKASNLSDLNDAATARSNLGLGSASTMSSTAFDPAGAAAARAAKGVNNDITALLALSVRVVTTDTNIGPGDQYLLVLASTSSKTITYGSTVQAGQVRVIKGDATYNPVNISDGTTGPYRGVLVSPRVDGYCQSVTVMKSTAGLMCF